MVQNGFVVEFTAAAGREDEVAAFLVSARAMVEREPETITWFAFRKDERTFGIFDAFETEEGRAFHLQGEVRQAIDANGISSPCPRRSRRSTSSRPSSRSDVTLPAGPASGDPRSGARRSRMRGSRDRAAGAVDRHPRTTCCVDPSVHDHDGDVLRELLAQRSVVEE